MEQTECSRVNGVQLRRNLCWGLLLYSLAAHSFAQSVAIDTVDTRALPQTFSGFGDVDVLRNLGTGDVVRTQTTFKGLISTEEAEEAPEQTEEPRFQLNADLGGSYTNNAFDSNDNHVDDFVALPRGRLDFSLYKGDNLRLVTSAGFELSRHSDNPELDQDQFVGSVSALTQWRGIDLGLTYAPRIVYDRGFSNRLVTLHVVALAAQETTPLGKEANCVSGGEKVSCMSLTTEFNAIRIQADPARSDQTRVGIGARLTRLFKFDNEVGENVSINIAPNISTRIYDDFDEHLFGDSREDYLISVGVSLAYQSRRWNGFSMIAGATFTHRASSLDRFESTTFQATPQITAVVAF